MKHYFVKGTQTIKPSNDRTPFEVVIGLNFETNSSKKLLNDIKWEIVNQLKLSTCNESHVETNISLVSIDYIAKL